MEKRRQLIKKIGCLSAAAFAGCGEKVTESQVENPPRDTDTRNPETGFSEATTGETENTGHSSDYQTETPTSEKSTQTPTQTSNSTSTGGNELLPGPPVKRHEGHLPVMSITAPQPEYTESGFRAEGAKSHTEFLEVAERGGDPAKYHIGMAATHHGTGRASAIGTVGYQTAWKAPKSGRYKLSVGYLRTDYYEYRRPEHGDVGLSMDSHLIATRAADSFVVSRNRQPDLRYRSGKLSQEALELFIETGITLLVGRALGLGLIARQVLGEIVDHLIEIEIQRTTSERTPWKGVHELSTTFSAHAGESFLFEYSATAGYDVDLNKATVFPFLQMDVQPQWIAIEPV